MDPRDQIEERDGKINSNVSSSTSDIDQLCHLLDETTFSRPQGLSRPNYLSSRFRSVPACQVKTFRSSRLKRLHSSSLSSKPSSISKDECCSDDIVPSESDPPFNHCRSLVPIHHRRTLSMRFSLSSPSLLNRFRSLSTYSLPQQPRRGSHLATNMRSSQIRYPSPATITLFRTQSSLPSIVEEDANAVVTSGSTTASQSQLSCTIVDTRRANATACNVEELAAYLDNFLYLPKSLSGAAELMYT